LHGQTVDQPGALGEVAHGRLETELVESGRAELRDQPAQLLHLCGDVLLRLSHLLAQALGRARPRAGGQQHVDPGQALERLVVELAGPARALRLGRLQPLPRRQLARLVQRRLHPLALAYVGEDDHRARAAWPGHGAAAAVDRKARSVAAPEALARERRAALSGPRSVQRAVLARVRRAARPRVVEQLVGRLPDQLVPAPAEQLRCGRIRERDHPAVVDVVDALAGELEDAVVVARQAVELFARQIQRRTPLAD